MPELTHLSLFSGIGGLDLAAERAGFRTVGQCEWADYPRKVLEKHWPGLPRWRDIRTLTKESFYEQTGLESVTVLSGGFPCQPFSTAGKRRGKEDDRYLWPEMLRVIQEIRPRWVVGENVAGIVSMALDTVLSDLENIGYACQALIIPACAVDAPHRRDRCAIVARTKGERCRETRSGISRPEKRTAGGCENVAYSHGRTMWNDSDNERTSDREVDQTVNASVFGRESQNVADTHCEGLERCEQPGSHPEAGRGTKSHGAISKRGAVISIPDSPLQPVPVQAWGGRPGSGNIGRWPAEPEVGRVAHGVPNRVDRLKCLGNAVVPQQFYPIFRAIAEVEANHG